jgi:hypothetical protein
VIGTWQDPVMSGYAIGSAPMAYGGDSIRRHHRKVLADTVADVTGGRATAVDIATRVV